MIPIGKTENSNEEATRIGGALERLAVRFGCAIVLLHHCGKPKDLNGNGRSLDTEPDVRFMGRGASALVAKARAVASLEIVGGMNHLRRIRTIANLGPAPKPALFQVCSEKTEPEELLYFRPTTLTANREPAEVLEPGESISTNDLARRLAGDSLDEGKTVPGDLKREATALREQWLEAGKVTVKDGKRGAKMVALAAPKKPRIDPDWAAGPEWA